MNTYLNPPSPGLVETLFRHKGKVVLIPVLSLATAALVILCFPRTYHSDAVLFLQVGRESVGIDPVATTGQTISLQQSGRDDEVKSAIDILRSRGVIAKTVERLGSEVVLGETEASTAAPNALTDAVGKVMGAVGGWIGSIDPISEQERAIIAIQESLDIDSDRGSTAIGVDIEADSPQLAQLILTELIDVFTEEHTRIHRNQGSQAFFNEQQQKLQLQLDEAKQAVRDAKNEMGIGSVVGRRETIEGQLRAIELEKSQTEQALASATARVVDLRQQIASLPDRVATSTKTMPNEGADLLREQLYGLEIRKAELSSRYSDEHPLVIAVNQQLKEAQKVVDGQELQRQETVDDVNPVHQQLSLTLKDQQSLVAGYESRLETIEGQLQMVGGELNKLNDQEVRLDQLDREVRLRDSKFYKYANNYEQARIDQELEAQRISNVGLLQTPQLIEKPVSPSKMLVLLASLFLATAGTGAAILASERLNDKVRTEDEVVNLLGVPVLASIPASTAGNRMLVH